MADNIKSNHPCDNCNDHCDFCDEAINNPCLNCDDNCLYCDLVKKLTK